MYALICMHACMPVAINVSGLKVGQMTRTMWITWVTFLMGRVGIIHKSGCDPDFLVH